MDEIWAHKESVASNVLADLSEKIKTVSTDVRVLSTDLKKLETALSTAVTEIRNDMMLRHQAVDFHIDDHKDRIDGVYKVFYWLIGLVGTVLVTSLLYMLITH
jgi:hypothetical protein